MKGKKLLQAWAGACAAVCVLTFAACSSEGKSTLLGEPAAALTLSNADQSNEQLTLLRHSADNFSSQFTAAAYECFNGGENFAVSPVSAYSALSLAAACADGQTREELLTALGVTYNQLSEGYSYLYSSLNVEFATSAPFGGQKITSMLKSANSLWLNKGAEVNTSCIDALSNEFYAYSYSADFAGDNVNANRALSNFVKKQTNGLIDCDFQLSRLTRFVLMNTLYLKDIWNIYGDELLLTDQYYNFEGSLGKQSTALLQGYYTAGRAYSRESYSTYFARTCNGYEIKFILPNEGYTLDDVFTAETLAEINALDDYGGVDEVNKIRYYTRCLFPEFTASFDDDLKDILKDRFGVRSMFDEYTADFSALSMEKTVCDKIWHAVSLTVNRKGIEGAAVTAIPSAGEAGPDEYAEVYEDFVVDKSFGFILTDRYGVTLFSGVVSRV